jgi:hypothetical protein
MTILQALLVLNLASVAQAQDASRTFLHTGRDQSFVVPPGVTQLRVKMWAAGGGGGITDRLDANSGGGGGGFTNGIVTVQPGELLTLIVGAAGETTGAQTEPNYGGGGRVAMDWDCGFGSRDPETGTYPSWGCTVPHWLPLGEGHAKHAGSGGGRAAIRRGSVELATAGGGGGGGEGTNDGFGGGGGGLAGRPGGATGDATEYDGFGGGGGGTQDAKGAGGTPEGDQHTGSFSNSPLGGAGGGGWFGGGGSSTNDKPGGGGSGYVGGMRAGASTAAGHDGGPYVGGRGAGQKDSDYPHSGVGNGGGVGERGGDAAIVLSWSTGVVETECPWLQPANTPDDVLTCMDGTTCGAPGAPDWACCNDHGGRGHCPVTSSDRTR